LFKEALQVHETVFSNMLGKERVRALVENNRGHM